MQALLSSMTNEELDNAEILYKNGSRKRRIVAGSGSNIVELNRLLKQFKQMQTMTKKFSKMGDMKQLFSKMSGGFPK